MSIRLSVPRPAEVLSDPVEGRRLETAQSCTKLHEAANSKAALGLQLFDGGLERCLP